MSLGSVGNGNNNNNNNNIHTQFLPSHSFWFPQNNESMHLNYTHSLAVIHLSFFYLVKMYLFLHRDVHLNVKRNDTSDERVHTFF